MGGSCTQLAGKKYAVPRVIQIRDVPDELHDALTKAAMTESSRVRLRPDVMAKPLIFFCSESTLLRGSSNLLWATFKHDAPISPPGSRLKGTYV